MIAKVTRQALSLITTPHHLILTLVVGGTRSLYLNLSRSTYLLFGNTRSLQKCICSIVEHRSKKLFSVGSSSSPPPPPFCSRRSYPDLCSGAWVRPEPLREPCRRDQPTSVGPAAHVISMLFSKGISLDSQTGSLARNSACGESKARNLSCGAGQQDGERFTSQFSSRKMPRLGSFVCDRSVPCQMSKGPFPFLWPLSRVEGRVLLLCFAPSPSLCCLQQH